MNTRIGTICHGFTAWFYTVFAPLLMVQIMVQTVFNRPGHPTVNACQMSMKINSSFIPYHIAAVFARPMFDVSSHQIFNVLSIARFTHFAKKTCLMFISKIVTQEWYSIFDSTQHHTLTRSTVVQYRKDTCFVERMNEQ